MAFHHTTARNEGSTFPTFLDQDPFPSPRLDRPTSSGSDATSEFDARSQRDGSAVPSTTGPVGEPGLPPSRPATSATNDGHTRGHTARTSFNAPPSRRGLAMYSRDGSSRPSSGVGQTHVPSLPAQGFFRPMSPHALQTQRGSTISPPVSSQGHRQSFLSHEHTASVDEEEPVIRPNRFSNASVMTERDGRPSIAVDENAPPLPTSRGLSIATSTEEPGGVQSAVGAGSVMTQNSTTPLNMRQVQEQNQLRGAGANSLPPPKSPRSFRASLGLGSRHSSQRIMPERKPSKTHEKIPSDPSSPAGLANEKAARSTQQSHASPKTNGRNYQYFAGNMLFFCSGRFINTRAKPLNVLTFLLTVLPVALFFAFSAPWLWVHISPALPIVFAYVFYLTISAFLHAAFSDAGILPRKLHPHPPNPEEERDPLTVGPATTQWVMVKTFPSSRKHSDPQSNEENGQQGPTTAMEVPTKYCKSCGIWRPPRAHHCRVCDACIETQDHHCVWLNNCVGRRNYRFFFAYVGFSSVLAILLLAFTLVHIGYYAQQNNLSFGDSLTGRIQERIAFAMFIYSLLALPYPGSLFGYHLFLIARGETTREYLNSHKFLPADRHRPFSQPSFLANWVAVLCRPRPPTYMSFRRPHLDDDVRLGHLRTRKERVERARLDAARSDSRVGGLKKRFSVQYNDTAARSNGDGRGGGSGGGDGDVEMKRLPSPPPTTTTIKSPEVPPFQENDKSKSKSNNDSDFPGGGSAIGNNGRKHIGVMNNSTPR